ncbi:MAG: TonB-dependent receptor, partial [Myxococcales bacterium]|nr:TonB-dependent receptor [Myxococcales bacterium]
PDCEAHRCQRVVGTVQRAGDRGAVADVRVTVAPSSASPSWTATTRTDPDGTFDLQVPPGEVLVVVLAPGFERYEATLVVKDPQPREVHIVLRPTGPDLYRTVVPMRRDVQPGVSPRRLDPVETATLPGTQGDALRALQSLPGVARTPGGLGLLVLRGANPNQSVVFVGEHRVPRAFHALAISSVIPSDALDEVEYVPGNFSSRYGNATGGAVILRPRAGRRDGVHGHTEVDLAASGALVEAPLGRGSVLVAAQRSYIDAVLRTVERIDPNQTFVLPAAWDYQLFVDQPVSSHTAVAVRVLGSEDRVRSRFRTPDSIQTGLELRAGFHRADLELRYRQGPWRLLLSPSFRYEHQRFGVDDYYALRRDYVASGRAELGARLGPRADLTFGADLEVDPFRTITTDPSAGMEPAEEQADALHTSTGVYAMTELRLRQLSLTPGVRVNAFTLDESAKLGVDPRLLARWEPSPRWAWAGGVGLYSQPKLDADSAPTAFFASDVLSFGKIDRWRLPSAIYTLAPDITLSTNDSNVRIAQALQASTAVTYAPTSAWDLEVGGFVRVRDESLATIHLSSGESFAFTPAITRNQGLEVLLRRHRVGHLYGWIAYTLSWSRNIEQDPLLDRRASIDSFDQRHNLALVASYALPRRWRIGGRFRLVSGSPYTPVVGAIDNPSSSALGGVT